MELFINKNQTTKTFQIQKSSQKHAKLNFNYFFISSFENPFKNSFDLLRISEGFCDENLKFSQFSKEEEIILKITKSHLKEELNELVEIALKNKSNKEIIPRIYVLFKKRLFLIKDHLKFVFFN